jgi:hypothetical protein
MKALALPNRLLILFALAGAMLAQSATRAVNVSWTASVSSGVTGYTISTGAAAAGPFTQKGCVGTVAGSTCVSGSTASTTTYADTETVGSTVFYQVAAIAAACTNTTPVTQACGASVPATASATIPPQPGVTTVLLVVP